MNAKLKGVLAALFANASFGLAVVWTKQSYETYTPIASSLGRVLVAVIGLFLFALISRQMQRIKRKDLPLFILSGFFVPFLFYVLSYEGIAFVDAIVAGIIFATVPLFSPLASYLAFGSKFSKLFFIGMVTSFVGVLIALTHKGFSFDSSTLGVLLLLLGVFSSVSFSVLIKKLTNDYSNTVIILYTSIVGLILLFISFMIFEFKDFVNVEHTFDSTMAVVYMGAISSFLGYIYYAKSIKILGVGNAMMFFNLVPVFAALGAFVLLGEDIPNRKLIGMFIVIVGLYLTMIKVKNNNKPKEKLPEQ